MNNTYTAAYWIEKLQLISHIEGGAFRETYRAGMLLPHNVLTEEHNGERSASTAIYFLLQAGEFSAFHRIASDELWHHYDGHTLSIYEITASGTLLKHLLGKDLDMGEMPQVLIQAGSWFASRVDNESGYTLSGCTVAPGFDFADFELADRNELARLYPQYEELITGLTRI